MRIIAVKTIREYSVAYPNAAKGLSNWLMVARQAGWNTPNDVRQQDPAVTILAGNRLCFNIQGNGYRLIVGVNYLAAQIYIKWFGTHAEYDHIDANTVEHR